MSWLSSLSLGAQAAGRRPRVAVAGINHESNSFNARRTCVTDFSPRTPPLDRDAFLREHLGESTTVSGFVEAAARLDIDVVPGLVATATPSGNVEAAAFETLVAVILAGIEEAKPGLDGVYLSLHGAMVVEGFPSGDAELVRRVRAAVGPDCPIVVTHDFHANVSAEIVASCNALVTYKENPHIDTKARGVQAAEIMAGIIRGKIRPVQVIVKPPMIFNIAFQHTKSPPLLPITDESRRLEEQPKILAASVAGGYQYADVPQIGPSVIVVTDGDLALAQREADRLAAMLWAAREKIGLNLPDAASAVTRAMASPKTPVVLMDTGDNIGGGAAGDSTFLLAELVRQKATGWVVVLADRAAVEVAARAGVGQPFDLPVGAKADALHGTPVPITGHVRSLNDGKFFETEVRHLGSRYHDMGRTAVIEVAGSTPDMANLVVLTTERCSPYSLHQLISVGVTPERQRIIVVKGTVAPRAAYEPIAAEIIVVDTPGSTTVNPRRLVYRHARRPLFGLE